MTIDKKYLYLIAGLVIGAIIFYALSYSSSQFFQKGIDKDSAVSSNSDTLNSHFIEQMIPHHEDAIVMSELALEKSSKPEVRELAQNIISAQAREIKEMKAWYKDWFGRELPSGDSVMNQHGMMGNTSNMHMGMMGSDMDLENLENSEDFDRAFIENMIPHHQSAVMMASMLRNGTNRPEMKELAENIITSQTEEIDLMRKWLTEWEK